MKATFHLTIKCVDERRAEELGRVLSPDNRGFPRDQEFASRRRGDVLLFSVASPRIMPALSTIGSILSDAKLFQEFSESFNRINYGRRRR